MKNKKKLYTTIIANPQKQSLGLNDTNTAYNTALLFTTSQLAQLQLSRTNLCQIFKMSLISATCKAYTLL